MGKLGPDEEMMMNKTLMMLQFFSCFIVGQLGEISFDEAISMSNIVGRLGTAYLRWNKVKISLGDIIYGRDTTDICAASPQNCVLVANANKNVESQVVFTSCLL